VFDPLMPVEVGDVAGEVAIHQCKCGRVGVDVWECSPLVKFVFGDGLFGYVAVDMVAGLRPETVQRQMPGIPSSILSALLFVAVGFAEGILPAKHEQFCGGLCCAFCFSIWKYLFFIFFTMIPFFRDFSVFAPREATPVSPALCWGFPF